MNTAVENRVRDAIANLKYDFAAFQITHFLEHFKTLRQRPLYVGRYPSDPDLYGLCYPVDEADYIIINARLHRVHQLHTVLHEVAHLHMNHAHVDLRGVLGKTLSQQLNVLDKVGHVRGTDYGSRLNQQQEDESEEFVRWIRREIAEARRLHELHTPTSIPEIEVYTAGLDFTRKDR